MTEDIIRENRERWLEDYRDKNRHTLSEDQVNLHLTVIRDFVDNFLFCYLDELFERHITKVVRDEDSSNDTIPIDN